MHRQRTHTASHAPHASQLHARRVNACRGADSPLSTCTSTLVFTLWWRTGRSWDRDGAEGVVLSLRLIAAVGCLGSAVKWRMACMGLAPHSLSITRAIVFPRLQPHIRSVSRVSMSFSRSSCHSPHIPIPVLDSPAPVRWCVLRLLDVSPHRDRAFEDFPSLLDINHIPPIHTLQLVQ